MITAFYLWLTKGQANIEPIAATMIVDLMTVITVCITIYNVALVVFQEC
jgi:hypothetical protein